MKAMLHIVTLTHLIEEHYDLLNDVVETFRGRDKASFTGEDTSRLIKLIRPNLNLDGRVSAYGKVFTLPEHTRDAIDPSKLSFRGLKTKLIQREGKKDE